MTSTVSLVIGGCRSGKSRHALTLAQRRPGAPLVYVATCEPKDAEMRRRVARHQAERGDRWRTVEEPVRLPETLDRWRQQAAVILVDCLTLWVSNLMLAPAGAPSVAEATDRLLKALSQNGCPVILVSNEVGAGIVPENALARDYRDQVGTVNQAVAACAQTVVWMVAGIPVAVKGTCDP